MRRVEGDCGSPTEQNCARLGNLHRPVETPNVEHLDDRQSSAAIVVFRHILPATVPTIVTFASSSATGPHLFFMWSGARASSGGGSRNDNNHDDVAENDVPIIPPASPIPGRDNNDDNNDDNDDNDIVARTTTPPLCAASARAGGTPCPPRV